MNYFTSANLKAYTSSSSYNLIKSYYSYDIQDYLKNIKIHKYDHWEQKGRDKALALFHFSSKNVPAYKDFLKKNSINPSNIKTFDDFKKLPTMDKKNYLSKYNLDDLCINGKLSSNHIISVSSGTSGVPYHWPRGAFQDIEGAFLHEVMLERLYKISERKTLAVILFSMGSYVAGTYTLSSLQHVAMKGYDLSILSPGLNTEDMVLQLKGTAKYYDQVLIFGYPPFVKDSIDDIIDNKRFSFENTPVRYVFASEFFSEDFRDYMLKINRKSDNKLSTSTNIYGAADATLFGYETPFTIKLRRNVESKNRYKSVFNSNTMPTVVEYNPSIRFFESINNNLVLTAAAGIPLIRYDLHDKGGILRKEDIADINKSKADNNLPLVYVTGRKNGEISFYGILIPREYISEVLEHSKFYNYLSGRYTIQVKQNEQKNPEIIIHLECKSDKNILDVPTKIIRDKITNHLSEKISEYRLLKSKIGEKATPRLKVYKKGHGKLFDTNIKQQWISHHS